MKTEFVELINEEKPNETVSLELNKRAFNILFHDYVDSPSEYANFYDTKFNGTREQFEALSMLLVTLKDDTKQIMYKRVNWTHTDELAAYFNSKHCNLVIHF